MSPVPPRTDRASSLPYLDTHTVLIRASQTAVWETLVAYAAGPLLFGPRHPLATVLGTQPHEGFEVAASSPSERLVLVGRHRFSVYRLEFLVSAIPGRDTALSAISRAEFPGLRGGAYRMLVVGTGAHVVATRGILSAVKRRAERSRSSRIRHRDGPAVPPGAAVG